MMKQFIIEKSFKAILNLENFVKLLPFPFQKLHKVSLNVHPVTTMADILGHVTNQFKYIQKYDEKYVLSRYNTEMNGNS